MTTNENGMTAPNMSESSRIPLSSIEIWITYNQLQQV